MSAVTATPFPSSAPAATAVVVVRASVVVVTTQLLGRVLAAVLPGQGTGLASTVATVAAVALCFAWAARDARRHDLPTVAVSWALASALAGVGSLLVTSVGASGNGSTVLDLMAVDASSASFVFFLCAIPAGLGAALGQAVSRR